MPLYVNSRLLRRKLLAMTQKEGLHPVNGYHIDYFAAALYAAYL